MDPPIAIVTGANSGIGLAVTVALARAGHVVHAGMRDAAAPDELLAAVASAPLPAAAAVHVLRMDVGSDASVASAVASVLAATGDRVDVAVACAGYGVIMNVEDATVEDVSSCMNVNFFGALRVVKAVVPAMRRRGAGRVIGVSSVAGLIGLPFYGPYAASKFAMEGFWECCAAEYKALGVHFIVVEPGPVATNVAARIQMKRSPPGDLAPICAAFEAKTVRSMMESMQSADECAAFFLRAVTDPTPALRYMTHEGSAELLRTKYVDLDGAGVAAATAAMSAPMSEDGGEKKKEEEGGEKHSE